MDVPCPSCGRRGLAVFLSEEAVRMETLLRTQFVFDRVDKAPEPEERKDLTSFVHSAAAELIECPRCRILVRRQPEGDSLRTYVEDPYKPDVMTHLLPRYIEAFRTREKPYRSLLPAGAEVLEVGPHFGAFMDVAREWGWRPAGVDIGRDTTRFVRSRGFEICDHVLQECGFADQSFDGIFIWNCFEQIQDAHGTLDEVHRLLKPQGLLVLRTPNALFYRVCQQRLKQAPESDLSVWILRALGYNNLLAFPYLYGYDSDSLVELCREHGFRSEAMLNSELIVLPFPQLESWIVEESRAAYALLRTWSDLEAHERAGRLIGPWMEFILRSA
jgi:SAM-dependent methyltransferase